MVDISDKVPTTRTATAMGRIYIPAIAYQLVTSSYPIENQESSPGFAKARRKGDALTIAQLAAIMGSKKTSDLIPLCHPLTLNKVSVTLTPEVLSCSTSSSHAEAGRHSILCRATVTAEGKTGVEMEALTAVSVGLLTVWDMLKAVAGKEMEIGEIKVVAKSGGRSGDFERST
jgi:molybdenum cofactor biosynthesis protein MoaC